MSSEQVVQHLLGTDLSHFSSLTRPDTFGQFFAIAMDSHEAHMASVGSDLLEDLLHKLVVLAFAVDKGENRVNSRFRGFFYHLQPIFAGETPEGLCSKLENRLDELDRDMIVEKFEPCQF